MIYEPVRISDIMHQYEQTRQDNEALLAQRRNEIYQKLPAIEELDNASRSSYLSTVLAMVSGKGNNEENAGRTIDYKTVREENRQRTAMKKQLLVDAGYPENYLEPIYTCPLCQDTGSIGQERCSCFRDKLINQLYLQSNLTNILEKENFNTFNLDYYSKNMLSGYDYSPYDNMVNILDSAKNFVDNFSKVSSHRGNIFIYGEVGLGKTFLTNCIAKEILDKGHQVFYLSANELFQNILSPYLMGQEKDLAELYKYVYNCELLIIDDLGTELINSFTVTNLFEIINKRNIQGRSTLISSNLGLKDLRIKYSERIMSRIVESYTVFNIYGENIRYQKRFNSTNN